MIFHMPACSGCGNCSMACSFHNEGEFVPAKAAIRSLEKEDGQGFEAWTQSLLDIIHGTALDTALIIRTAIQDAQGTGEEFCSHPHNGTHPHPENGTRTTHMDGHGDTTDVTHAHGAGQG